jgi:hypothetical protein
MGWAMLKRDAVPTIDLMEWGFSVVFASSPAARARVMAEGARAEAAFPLTLGAALTKQQPMKRQLPSGVVWRHSVASRVER